MRKLRQWTIKHPLQFVGVFMSMALKCWKCITGKPFRHLLQKTENVANRSSCDLLSHRHLCMDISHMQENSNQKRE